MRRIRSQEVARDLIANARSTAQKGLKQDHVVETQVRFTRSDQEELELLQLADEAHPLSLEVTARDFDALVGAVTTYQPTLTDFTTRIPNDSFSSPTLPPEASRHHYPLKRAVDVLLAVAILAVIAPLLLVLALVVLVSSGRPVFYSHERVGRDGRRFRCHKLRTMVPDADARLQALLREDADARDEFAATQKLRRDPRVTAVGRFLRRTSLDELPQFLNVLKGEMAIVGPRPVTTTELARYADAVDDYLAVRPGITGLWQVSGRNHVSYDERVRLDVAYVRNMSFVTDVSLVVRTTLVLVKGSAAY